MLTFWLPTLGPVVGGRKAGGVESALVAGVILTVLVPALVLRVGAAVELSVIGGLVGAGILVQGLPVPVGGATAAT